MNDKLSTEDKIHMTPVDRCLQTNNKVILSHCHLSSAPIQTRTTLVDQQMHIVDNMNTDVSVDKVQQDDNQVQLLVIVYSSLSLYEYLNCNCLSNCIFSIDKISR